MIFITLLVFTSVLFMLLGSLILYITLNRLNDDPGKTDNPLNFSIVVAAKNEEQNLPILFKSLSGLNYDKSKYEIIIVDDNSTDNTFGLCTSYREKMHNLRVLKTDHATLTGKKAALSTGIRNASFENIITTDSDCSVGKNWLNSFSNKLKFADVVFGVAPSIQTNSFVNKIACFDTLRAHIVTFASAKLGLPYSARASNFSFRKSAFEKINGYESANETFSGDDDLFLREAIKAGLKITTVVSEGSRVYSITKESFREYIKQKARHTSSSHYYLLSHKTALTFWHIINLIILFSFPLSLFNSIFVLPFMIKLLVDFLLTSVNQERFGFKFETYEIFYLQIIYEIMLVINFINSFRFKKRWE